MARKKSLASLAGTFWLSDNVRRKLDGFLDLEARFPTVKLVGGFEGYRGVLNAVVHGRLATHIPREVTLFNCYGGTTTVGARKAETTIESTLVVAGGHFHAYDGLQGLGIEFRLENVSRWFYRKAFDFADPDTSDIATVSYKTYEEFSWPIANGLSLTAIYTAPFFVGGWGSEDLTISRTLRLRLSGEASRTYEQWRLLAQRCRHLFSLLVNAELTVSDIVLFGIPTKADIRQKLGWRRLEATESGPKIISPTEVDQRPEPLIKHAAIADRFPQIVGRWFQMYDKHRDSIDSFFLSRARSDHAPDTEFLAAISAVEEIHRATTGKSQTKLRRRLLDLIAKWHSLVTTAPSDDVLDQIIASRDYYSHRDQRRRDEAAHGFLLKRYAHFLRALYILELLTVLGFHPAEVMALVGTEYEIEQALRLRAFPFANEG